MGKMASKKKLQVAIKNEDKAIAAAKTDAAVKKGKSSSRTTRSHIARGKELQQKADVANKAVAKMALKRTTEVVNMAKAANKALVDFHKADEDSPGGGGPNDGPNDGPGD